VYIAVTLQATKLDSFTAILQSDKYSNSLGFLLTSEPCSRVYNSTVKDSDSLLPDATTFFNKCF